MSIERRRFIEMAVGVFAAGALPGCASVVMTRVTPSGGAITVSLRDFPQLDRPGGYLRVQPEGFAAPVYVLAMDQGGYVALSPICTHLGCTVNIEGPRLVCPCHGSTYDRVGRVVRGPAERSLRQFPLAASPDGVLVIQIEEGA
jgi:Rieske Fe-S protein